MRDFDVIVAGGGVSGVAAAIAAARNGARTLIIERHNCLGGTMAAALVGPMMTFHDSLGRQVISGIAQEIVDRLISLGASPGHVPDTSSYTSTITPFDSEALKLVAQRMVLEAGGEILFQTFISQPIMNANVVEGLVVENKGGRQSLGSKVVVDATGDADIAARAGAPCMGGRPGDNLTQPASLIFKIGGVDFQALKQYVRAHPEEMDLGTRGLEGLEQDRFLNVTGFRRAIQEARERGELHLERDHVLLFTTNRQDQATVNMSRLTRLNPTDPWEISRAEIKGREQVFEILSFLRRYIPGMDNTYLLSTGMQLGIRESRHILGEYVLVGDDCLQGRRFPDAIARSGYPIDIHQPDGIGNIDMFLEPGSTYDIPYRCLIPQQIEGLLANGRCISTDYMAHASARTSPTCMAIGQAAGTAAVLAVRHDVQPRNISTDELRQVLRDQGASLN